MVAPERVVPASDRLKKAADRATLVQRPGRTAVLCAVLRPLKTEAKRAKRFAESSPGGRMPEKQALSAGSGIGRKRTQRAQKGRQQGLSLRSLRSLALWRPIGAARQGQGTRIRLPRGARHRRQAQSGLPAIRRPHNPAHVQRPTANARNQGRLSRPGHGATARGEAGGDLREGADFGFRVVHAKPQCGLLDLRFILKRPAPNVTGFFGFGSFMAWRVAQWPWPGRQWDLTDWP